VIELALRNFLIDTSDGDQTQSDRNTARAAVYASVSNRVYYARRPQSTLDPALTIDRLGTLRFNDLPGEPAYTGAYIEIAAWAKQDGTPPITLVTLADNLRQAVTQYRGTMDTLFISGCWLENERMTEYKPVDASDNWTFAYTMDFKIMFSQTAVVALAG